MPRWWSLSIAAGLVILSLGRPRILRPFNRIWLAVGALLHKVVSPVVMGLIFFLVVTPIGWFMRLACKDVLALQRRPDLKSYWIKRQLSQPSADSMKNQF